MQVILRSDLAGLGKRGDIVEVADGHARNYLLPRGLAIAASRGAVTQAARMRRSRDERDTRQREAARALSVSLAEKVISVSAKAGPEGRLFGSVSAADVAAAIAEQAGVELDRHSIEVEGVKTVGEHSVTVTPHPEVSFAVRIDVVAAS